MLESAKPATFSERLTLAMEAASLSQKALAKAAGYKSQGAIGNAVSRGTPPKNMRAVARALDVRQEWLETGALPVGPFSSAHAVSQDSVTSPSQRTVEFVTWRGIGMRELPRVFAVEAPDDAMAPIFRRGMHVEFDREREPRSGEDIVLLHDERGDWYIRNYVRVNRERWKAKPQNTAAADDMDSVQDGLTVIAVLTNVRRHPT